MAYYKLYARCSAREFVEFWQQFYRSKIPDDVYQANLNVGGELNEENISLLWRWKNERYGLPLIEPTKAILPDINAFRQIRRVEAPEERDFWQKASRVSSGIVWQVFLFHMARPRDYPIFDQHVVRAFLALTQGYVYRRPKEARALSLKYEDFRSAYGNYRDFFFKVVGEAGSPEPKAVDRALWAFGRHLKQLHRVDGPLPLAEDQAEGG